MECVKRSCAPEFKEPTLVEDRGEKAGSSKRMSGWRPIFQRRLWVRPHEGVRLNELCESAGADVAVPAVGREMCESVRQLCHEGRAHEAVEALGVLVETEFCVSKALLYAVLKQCVAEKDLVLGRRMHALMVKQGYQSDTFLGTHVLRMYCSHGRLQDAMDVLGLVGRPDAFMWCAIISAHVRHGQNKVAVELYHRMRSSNVMADGHVFATALQACARGWDLRSGQLVHADVLANGLDTDSFICTCLVDMYAKCGSLQHAQVLFDGLEQKSVVTWSTLIAGYSQHGKGQEALRLYKAMQDDGMVTPDSVTFVCLLQACASVGSPALEKGRELHAQVRGQGLETDLFVANSLVNMYSKCGSLQEARGVFDALVQKDVVTWNAMVAAYSQQGMALEAFHLYTVMQETCVTLTNSVTFVCLLQACASLGLKGLGMGQQLHAQIRERRLDSDGLVANGLVHMYANCGSLEAARRVFDAFGDRDVVKWNTMIAGYSQQGMGQEALHLYSVMQEEGMVAPDPVTFVSLLQACASMGRPALETGKHLHAQIKEQGHETVAAVGNSLVNMYAKCGSLQDARRVFDGLVHKNVVTWNAMLAGYSQQGMGHEALELYMAMQDEGIMTPDSVTFVSLLQACASMGHSGLEIGKQLHAKIREGGHETDMPVANSVVNMYAKCGSVEDAERVFNGLSHKNVVTWNAMIAGCSQQGKGEEALDLYSIMQEEGLVQPNAVTFVCLLQSCASVGTQALEKGKQLHEEIREQGHEADVFVANSLVNMYAKCGSLEDAQRVFDELSEKDVVTWTALIAGYSQQGRGQEALDVYSAMQDAGTAAPSSLTFVHLLQACATVGTPALEIGKQLHVQIREQGCQAEMFVANSLVNMYAKCGSLDDAQRVFDGLSEKDVVTWTALISGYFQQGMGQEALRLYGTMQEIGIAVPNSVTFVCLLHACANVAALHLGRQLHAQIEEQGLHLDPFLACSLINMYGKTGSLVEAQELFDALPERDIIAWSALIAGYACQGDSEVVFDLVQRMEEDGVRPTDLTFLSVLVVCSHAGLVNKGKEHFEAMRYLYGIAPRPEHYSCMVDLLGRAGHLEEAIAFVRTMPVLPSAAEWHTVLSACRKWSNVELGLHAFHQAVKLDNRDAAAYVLMANIYKSAKMWEQAHQMEARRLTMRAWKQAGQSWWTDTDGQVHSFLVGDEKH